MQEPLELSETLCAVFTPLLQEADRPAAYPFRPLVARSFERRTVFCVCTGQIGLADCERFKASLQELCTEQTVKIIADFSALSLTKSAVGALVAVAAFTHGLNKRLYLYAPSPQVRALLKELELTPFFSYLETEDDIISTLVV